MMHTRSKGYVVLLICISIFLIVFHNKIFFLSHLDIFFYKISQGPLLFLNNISAPLKIFKQVPTLYKENQRLKQQIAVFKNQAVFLREIESENERLKGLLSLKAGFPRLTTVARVVSQEPSLWSSTIIIDKGIKDGIIKNSPVLTSAGLVGFVSESGDKNSRVILLQDPNFRVHSIVQRSRVTGVFEGKMEGQGILKYVPVDADVQKGDSVVTSGMGGLYPKGIFIGTVEEVVRPFGSRFCHIRIKIAVDFSKTEEVICIR